MFEVFTSPPQRAALERERAARLASTPIARFQYVDVTFLAPDQDLAISHTLAPLDPTSVCYIPVRLSAGAVVYQDQSASATPWTSSLIRLRASAACAATLLLFIHE